MECAELLSWGQFRNAANPPSANTPTCSSRWLQEAGTPEAIQSSWPARPVEVARKGSVRPNFFVTKRGEPTQGWAKTNARRLDSAALGSPPYIADRSRGARRFIAGMDRLFASQPFGRWRRWSDDDWADGFVRLITRPMSGSRGDMGSNNGQTHAHRLRCNSFCGGSYCNLGPANRGLHKCARTRTGRKERR